MLSIAYSAVAVSYSFRLFILLPTVDRAVDRHRGLFTLLPTVDSVVAVPSPFGSFVVMATMDREVVVCSFFLDNCADNR